ncbi:MAG: GatB/YqeY domain-containing protein [Nereida ignava]|uniref:GatB/YqeY domain-containing protein n=1 Tax=Nereida TaxID=282198 RepID=UPI0030F5A197
MTMKEQISAALKEAMKAKDTARLSTLRLVNAAIKDREIAARGSDEVVSVSDADITSILGKMVKQRKESAKAYEEGGRLELAEKELQEISIIEDYLPKQLDADETAAAVQEAIRTTGAEGIRDMGKVMAALKAAYTGQMDFGSVGPMVKDQLNS